MKNKTSITFEIDKDEKKKFQGLCIQHDDDMSAVLRKCIKHYIDDHKPRFVQIA